MLKITLEGPPGCGKTQIANQIIDANKDKKIILIEECENTNVNCYNNDIVIFTKQTK